MRRIALFGAVVALALAPAAAIAQSAGGGTPATQSSAASNQPVGSAGTLTAVTATTTSAALTPANASRAFFFVSNEAPSGGGNVAVCPASVSSPAVNAAGCKTLYPGQFWAACSSAVCPTDAFNIIATTSTPVLFGQK